MKKKRYGDLYRLTDFMGSYVSKRRDSYSSTVVLRSLFQFFNDLEVLISERPDLTFVFSVGGSSGNLAIYHSGERELMVLPRVNKLGILAYGENERLVSFFDDSQHSPHISRVASKEWWSLKWDVEPDGFSLILEYINKLPEEFVEKDPSHPRYFPGVVRHAALQEFLDSGRICPGVGEQSKKHKVKEGERIEFDHILPYSQGGASTMRNIQVLCMECNRAKSGTAK